MSTAFSSCKHGTQRGTAALEFTLAAPVLLLAGLAVAELAQWHQTRQAVSLALLEAARAGSVMHAHPATMDAAFHQALHPWRLGRPQGQPPPSWHIQVLSPSSAAFRLHADTSLRVAMADGRPAIRHDYQPLQHQRRPNAAPTIFEANTLALQLHYEHTPLTPLVAAVLRALGNPSGNWRQRTYAAGRLPLVRELALPMQSHPVDWSSAAVSLPLNDLPATVSSAAPVATAPAPADRDTRAAPDTHDGSPLHDSAPTEHGPAATLAEWPAATPPGVMDADDALCGIALCCTT